MEGTPVKVGRVETGRMEHPTPEQTIFRAVTEVAGPCALHGAMAHPCWWVRVCPPEEDVCAFKVV